eukprot:CAMPEP_0170142786 /NCGR_PEP_ID=MMETSP0033_2-20121228/8489_1 /TAXON_ID=195969 /ORGANISM="Dolichomastix tenuilepis, Strain CCMP3274" /LENGTH=34 /DNA_ID= /DNA_START= /DNA_END= /DNA_ORIENTATION=
MGALARASEGDEEVTGTGGGGGGAPRERSPLPRA